MSSLTKITSSLLPSCTDLQDVNIHNRGIEKSSITYSSTDLSGADSPREYSEEKNPGRIFSHDAVIREQKTSEKIDVHGSSVLKTSQQSIAARLAQGSSSSLLKMYPANSSVVLCKKTLQNALDNYKRIVGITVMAAKIFSEKDFRYFDPLVGENACQIRAALYSDLANQDDIQENLNKWIGSLEETLQKLHSIKLPDKTSMSLSQVLMENQIKTEISGDVYSLLLGYILTITKNSQLKIEKDTSSGKIKIVLTEENKHTLLQEKFSAIKEGGATLAKELIKLAKKQLSEVSISYLRQSLASMPYSNETKRLQEALSDNTILSSPNGILTARFLPGLEVLMKHLLRRKTPIILNVKLINSDDAKDLGTTSILYLVEGNRYVPIDPGKQIQPSAAFVIHAASIGNQIHSLEELRNKIVREEISDIILANGAAHPQYGGTNKHIEPPVDARRETLKAKALQAGLCELNPQLAQIYHVHAGSISQHYQPAKQK